MSVIVHMNNHSSQSTFVYSGADFYTVPEGDHLNVYRALPEGESGVMRTLIATLRDWSAVSIIDEKAERDIEEKARVAAMAAHPSTWRIQSEALLDAEERVRADSIAKANAQADLRDSFNEEHQSISNGPMEATAADMARLQYHGRG